MQWPMGDPWVAQEVTCAEQSSFLCTCLRVGTDRCRSHKVSCRNMTEGTNGESHVLSACIWLEVCDLCV